jgi:hypothetical protein
MTYYVIKQISTGKYLPLRKKSQTHSNMTDKGPPRLFKRKGDARQALNYWLKGKWYIEVYSPECYDTDLGVVVMPNTQRDAEDYTIVEVKLVEKIEMQHIINYAAPIEWFM